MRRFKVKGDVWETALAVLRELSKGPATAAEIAILMRHTSRECSTALNNHLTAGRATVFGEVGHARIYEITKEGREVLNVGMVRDPEQADSSGGRAGTEAVA